MKNPRLPSVSLLSSRIHCFSMTVVVLVFCSDCYGQSTASDIKEEGSGSKQNTEKNIIVEKEKFPEFSKVVNEVKKQLKTINGYRKNDLISRTQMQGVFPKIEKLGWKVTDAKAILKRVLPSSHYLVRQLHSAKGKRFMRKINSKKQSYSYLDRLSRMPHGRARVKEFIKGPGGDKMILYFSDSKYGRKTGELVSRGKRGANFNKPTMKIYTAREFVDALKESYARTLKERAEEKKNAKPEPKKTATSPAKKKAKPATTKEADNKAKLKKLLKSIDT